MPLVEIDATNKSWIHFPQDLCCNCGTQQERICSVATTLRWITYLGIGGVETAERILLPYCQFCQVTATRRPPGIGRRFLVWALLFFVGMLCLPLIPGANQIGIQAALLANGAVAAALVCARIFATRPRGKQTSYYQPVRLRTFGLVLAFTSSTYARQVLAANPEVTRAVGRLRTPLIRRRALAWITTVAVTLIVLTLTSSVVKSRRKRARATPTWSDRYQLDRSPAETPRRWDLRRPILFVDVDPVSEEIIPKWEACAKTAGGGACTEKQ